MRFAVAPGLLLLVIACLDQMPLPVIDTREFQAGDTTYLLLSPTWSGVDGLIAPVGVAVSHARQIFVTDTGAHDVFVFDQAGSRIDLSDSTFATLQFDHLGPGFAPTDLDIDGRLNLLMINGSNKVYRWNQYWNMVGIDSVASEILFEHKNTGERLWFPPFTREATDYLQDTSWTNLLDSSRYEKNDAVIDSLLRPHEFFDMAFWRNQEREVYYNPDRTVFSAISGARLDDYFFYIADSMQNRILMVELTRNGVVKLGDGNTYYTHFALFVANVKEVGTGAGTVNRPTSLDVDNFGNIYWSQLGKQFYVHSVTPSVPLSFPTNFYPEIDDIMTSDQYLEPNDVAVDQRQMIYVANTDRQEILVFGGDGKFFKKAGVETVHMDTTMWVPVGGEGTFLDTSLWVFTGTDSTLIDTSIFIPAGADSALVDTFVTVEIKGQLIEPVSVAVDERGVIYVCDPGQGSVVRFILSTSIDEDLTNINQ